MKHAHNIHEEGQVIGVGIEKLAVYREKVSKLELIGCRHLEFITASWLYFCIEMLSQH